MGPATTSADPPGVVCITGMHRSGTSLLAGLMERLGVDLGDPETLLPPGQDNPRGYWEHRAIKELDDELLTRLGGSWDQPPLLVDGWAASHRLDDLRARAHEVLDGVFGPLDERAAPLGFKDPRMSLLLPFWQTVLPIDRVVAVVRDPREVARSLGVRNALPHGQSALLWLRHLAALVHDAPDLLLVPHRALFTDLPGTLRSICRHLGLPDPDAATVATAAELVDPTLVHHAATAPDLATEPLVALAEVVHGDGDVDLDRLDPLVRDAVRQGWLRPPPDTLLLDHARARMVQMEATMRSRRRRALARAAAGSEPSTTTEADPSPAAGGDLRSPVVP